MLSFAQPQFVRIQFLYLLQTTLPDDKEDDRSEILCFNVGGKRYYCMRRNFERYPDTKTRRTVKIRMHIFFRGRGLFLKVQCISNACQQNSQEYLNMGKVKQIKHNSAGYA